MFYTMKKVFESNAPARNSSSTLNIFMSRETRMEWVSE